MFTSQIQFSYSKQDDVTRLREVKALLKLAIVYNLIKNLRLLPVTKNQ